MTTGVTRDDPQGRTCHPAAEASRCHTSRGNNDRLRPGCGLLVTGEAGRAPSQRLGTVTGSSQRRVSPEPLQKKATSAHPSCLVLLCNAGCLSLFFPFAGSAVSYNGLGRGVSIRGTRLDLGPFYPPVPGGKCLNFIHPMSPAGFCQGPRSFQQACAVCTLPRNLLPGWRWHFPTGVPGPSQGATCWMCREPRQDGGFSEPLPAQCRGDGGQSLRAVQASSVPPAPER